MRSFLLTGLSAAALALAVPAAAQSPKPAKAPPRPAASAEQYGVAASYRMPAAGRGYSARDRHMADCLATYRHYDPQTDQVRVRPGVSRRCGL